MKFNCLKQSGRSFHKMKNSNGSEVIEIFSYRQKKLTTLYNRIETINNLQRFMYCLSDLFNFMFSFGYRIFVNILT